MRYIKEKKKEELNRGLFRIELNYGSVVCATLSVEGVSHTILTTYKPRP